MPHGNNGKILHVNLSLAAVEIEQPPAEFYRKSFEGGPSDGWKIDKSEMKGTRVKD